MAAGECNPAIPAYVTSTYKGNYYNENRGNHMLFVFAILENKILWWFLGGHDGLGEPWWTVKGRWRVLFGWSRASSKRWCTQECWKWCFKKRENFKKKKRLCCVLQTFDCELDKQKKKKTNQNMWCQRHKVFYLKANKCSFFLWKE